jgi:hypothetical protein
MASSFGLSVDVCVCAGVGFCLFWILVLCFFVRRALKSFTQRVSHFLRPGRFFFCLWRMWTPPLGEDGSPSLGGGSFSFVVLPPSRASLCGLVWMCFLFRYCSKRERFNFAFYYGKRLIIVSNGSPMGPSPTVPRP